jgi:hypothetical protein
VEISEQPREDRPAPLAVLIADDSRTVIAANHPRVSVAIVSSVGGRPRIAEEAFRLAAKQVMGKPFDRDVMGRLFDSVRAGS